MQWFHNLIDKIRQNFKKIFVADELDSKIARKKHLRLGLMVTTLFLVASYVIFNLGNKIGNAKNSSGDQHNKNNYGNASNNNSSNVANNQNNNPHIKQIDIESLAQGVTNEKIWVEGAEKEIEQIKQQQIHDFEEQEKLKNHIVQDKVGREELAELIARTESAIEDKYNKKLEDEIEKIKLDIEKQSKLYLNNHQPQLETKSFVSKKKIKQIGDYIPAGSYAEAKTLSGVDAGVGMTAEADPRQMLLRITGAVVSAGFGPEYLKSNRLIGCILQCQAVGDISSEKVYLKMVLLTCAKDKNTVIEIPVKGYVSSQAKVGIRGEVVSREGDMVLKSFLSGVVGGFGSSAASLAQAPQLALTTGGLFAANTNTKHQVKDVAARGLGSGVGTSSDRLADYFIKRAEQYQPVISINEGTEVYVVFQEGFSLKEDEKDEKSANVNNK